MCYVIVGGVIGNDVYGKNYYLVGSFGYYVLFLELLCSDGECCVCWFGDGDGWFEVIVGGFGLIGLVIYVELQLCCVLGSSFEVENICFFSLVDFFVLLQDSSESYEYSVVWIDCLVCGCVFGRGYFICVNYVV